MRQVFEGGSDFIAGIMDSSSELYAAAASLGMDVQVFYSYSSEMTDEIILSCIEQSLRISRGFYPKMPESQTLGESFLTAFPLINPLSAHAILSSVGSLAEFLGGSHEHRIQALQNYQVPDESIRLLSVLTRFGELEDSRSGMTDCSSSASAPDSESLHSKRNSGGKKRKNTSDSGNLNMPMTELFDFYPPRPFSESRLNHLTESGLHDSWTAEDLNLLEEFPTPGLSFDNESCFQGQSFDTCLTKDFFKVDSTPYTSTFVGDLGQGRGRHLTLGFNHENIRIKRQKGASGKDVALRAKCFSDLAMRESNTARYGKTTLSNALHSTGSQKESPWPKEFLNRIREKGLSPTRAFLRDLSAPCYEYPGKSSKVTKRKSPSLLDFFKYQGNSSQRAATRRESQLTECIQQLPASTSKKASHQLIPQWTPIDKRAKKDLSFARNGGQTKLVWSDKSSHTLGRQ